jgi:hypothetical protein
MGALTFIDRNMPISVEDDVITQTEQLDISKRFDDTYKILLIIGPVLSFSLNSFSSSDVTQKFVQDIGFSFLLLSALLWALPNIFGGKWQYQFKMIGFILLVFVFLILCAVVFSRGQFMSFIWYIFVVIFSTLITYKAGELLVKDQVFSHRYQWIMILFSAVIGIAMVPFIIL